METKRTESKFGRARPRRSLALMMALVIVAVMSFAGVVSADNYWKGTAPETELQGTVNGGVDVLFSNTWTTPDDPVTDSAWANFTLEVDPSTVDMKFARLYVLVYMGNMTANYYGNESIKLYNDDEFEANLAGNELSGNQPLHTAYDKDVGTSIETNKYADDEEKFLTLNRVTSDYLNVFDVTGYIEGQNVNVFIQTWNESDSYEVPGFGKFDGRIKEAKLVYGWDYPEIHYWINEGHDTFTKDLVAPYYGENVTSFSSVYNSAPYTAKLMVDYSGYGSSGKGKYTWNDIVLPTTTGSGYDYSYIYGTYGGLHTWEWTDASALLGLDSTDYLTYANTSAWYKIPLAVLTVKEK